MSEEHLAYLQKVKRDRRKVFLGRLAIMIFFVLGWELAGRWGLIDPFIASQPSRIVNTVINLYREGQLFNHIGITMLENIVGFISGTLIGTVLAVGLWWSEYLSRVLDPYLVVLNALPKVALGPILIVWVGSGAPAIIAMALLISLIVTVLTVYSGFKQVDQEKIRLLKTFGANKRQLLQMIILPASVPTIVSALKINVGLSWVGVITGEFLVSKAGLGYLIVYGGQVFKLDLVMASVIILAIAAALMYQGVVALEKRLLKAF
ncbi:MAG: ABC transporter permease [Peptococcia bacterium]